jgi:hypothetical protein
MKALLSEFDSAEFAVVVDYLTRTTKVLAEQTRKLGGKAPAQKAKAGELRPPRLTGRKD